MAEYTNNSFKAKEEKKERTEKQAVDVYKRQLLLLVI